MCWEGGKVSRHRLPSVSPNHRESPDGGTVLIPSKKYAGAEAPRVSVQERSEKDQKSRSLWLEYVEKAGQVVAKLPGCSDNCLRTFPCRRPQRAHAMARPGGW